MFWGNSFSFDSIPSETFNLYINSFSANQTSTSQGSSDTEIYSESIYKRPVVYLYGTRQTPVLELDLEFTAPSEIIAPDAEVIQRWLFGHNNYKKLNIIQNDMQDVYFNCLLRSPEIIRDGNIIIGFKCKALCDSPFAWTYDKTLTKTYTDSDVVEIFNFDNLSDNNDYTYPIIQFTMNNLGGDFAIRNYTDGSRNFRFDALSPNEVITIDNNLQIVTSSMTTLRLSKFNKTWFRFLPGRNNLRLSGNISEVIFTYKFAKKIS